MIFTDLIFLFAFLPVYIIFIYCSSESWTKNVISLIASLLFLIWGRSIYYVLILLPIFLIYLCGNIVHRFKYAEAAGSAVAMISAVVGVIFLPQKNTLPSALISVGLLLFALRAALYLKEVTDGEPCERNFISLCVYLISFEGMLVSPVLSYSQSKKYLSLRKATLKKAAAGFPVLIKGFARAAIFGLVFDQVRLAAFEYEAFPWLNSVFLILLTAGEAYVLTAGLADISRGISLINGAAVSPAAPAFIPRAGLFKHVGELLAGYDLAIYKIFCECSVAAFSVSMGICVASCTVLIFYGCGAAGCFALITAASALSARAGGRCRIADSVFSIAAVCAGMIVLAGGSPDGMARLFTALDPKLYQYDITYILNYELTKRLPWLVLGIVSVSPLWRIVSGYLRKKSGESESLYKAIKALDTVLCLILLIVSTAAALR